MSVGGFLSFTIFSALLDTLKLLSLKFSQLLAWHVHQNQSVHDDVDRQFPIPAFSTCEEESTGTFSK